MGPLSIKLLFAQTQLLDQAVVPLEVLLLEIGEQGAALVDHHQQAAARVVVLVVALEVLGQVADALGEDRDLDFGGTCIALGLGVAGNDFLLLLGGNRHSSYSAVSVRLNPRTTLAVPSDSSISATGTEPAIARMSPSGWGNPETTRPCRAACALSGSRVRAGIPSSPASSGRRWSSRRAPLPISSRMSSEIAWVSVNGPALVRLR